MKEVIQGRPSGRPLKLVVGLADDVPKLIAYRFIQSALRVPERVQIACYEGEPEILVDDLVDQALDVVLTSSLVRTRPEEHVHSHLLGECGVTLFATRKLAARLRPSFPKSVDGAPMLLPTPNMGMRAPLDHWLADLRLCPRFMGEFQDTALLSVFGGHGLGVFPACSAVEADVRDQLRVEVVGRVSEIRQSFYAVTVERKLTHPSVTLMLQAARGELFPNEDDEEPSSA
jgi:LysR family transcriptional activator of nhaA